MAKKRGRNEGTIFKRRDGRWCAVVDYGWLGGRRQRKYLYAETRGGVADALQGELEDHANGGPLTVGRRKVQDFLAQWLTDSVKPSVRPLTFEQYDQHIRLYLTKAFGELQLRKLAQEPAYIQRFITWQLAAGLSARTVRISLFVLRRALNQAMKWKLIKRNPMDAVDLPRADRQVVKTFEEAEARSFLDAVRKDPLEAAYLLALLCGLRRGEVLGLRWADVGLEQQTLTVARALERIAKTLQFVEPKSASGRRVLPLPASVIAALKAHRVRQNEARLELGPAWHDEGLVFPNALGRPLEPRALSRRFKKVLEQAKLPLTLRLHDCRHFAATAMIADGTDVRTVAGLLGHADPSLTLRTYAHVVTSAARKATDRMGARA